MKRKLKTGWSKVSHIPSWTHPDDLLWKQVDLWVHSPLNGFKNVKVWGMGAFTCSGTNRNDGMLQAVVAVPSRLMGKRWRSVWATVACWWWTRTRWRICWASTIAVTPFLTSASPQVHLRFSLKTQNTRLQSFTLLHEGHEFTERVLSWSSLIVSYSFFQLRINRPDGATFHTTDHSILMQRL